MSILRENLKQKMAALGWNATVLSEKSGVPQPTIQRFLVGSHGDPRSTTIQKLAKGLGTTEEALRGFAEEADPMQPEIDKVLRAVNMAMKTATREFTEEELLTVYKAAFSAGLGVDVSSEKLANHLKFFTE